MRYEPTLSQRIERLRDRQVTDPQDYTTAYVTNCILSYSMLNKQGRLCPTIVYRTVSPGLTVQVNCIETFPIPENTARYVPDRRTA